ncbi:MAG: Nramp family divalent metal transporter [Phycisphaerales bacterium]|nr:MAG: Nramp family divalent metal transporter [Phycisphaerales bacterium]
MSWSKRFGPGLLVTAAFIGPGTITTATIAGAGFGLALLWVLLFSVAATIVLQEMSARLGLVSRRGLGEALRTSFANPLVRTLVIVLVVGAIAFGNAAFQTGNIIGAAMGLEVLSGISRPIWALIVGAAAFVLLWTGTYRIIERLLIALVAVMSVVFVLTAVMARPDPTEIVKGMFMPGIPAGSLTTIIALIGTTVVPYNLFLHASAVREKWPASLPLSQSLRESRVDTVIAVSLGGLITLAIVVTAAAFFQQGTTVENAAMMAEQLEPLLGPVAKYFFAAGLFAAGLTSAITAPLAAAYASAGALGFEPTLRSWKFRIVWVVVVVAGTVFAAIGESPVAAIIFAQAANGLILPVIAVFLLVVVNRRKLLGQYTNGLPANVLGVAVVVIAAALGVYKLVMVIARLGG